MQSKLFFQFGQYVYQFRMLIILLWVAIIISALPFLPHIMSPFQETGFVAENSESALTDKYLNKYLGYNNNRFLIVYHSKTLLATQDSYIDKLKSSLSALKNFPLKHEIIYPDENKKQISKDKHTAYVVILFKDNKAISQVLLKKFKAAIKKPANMSMHLGGEAIFVESVNHQTQKDLFKADMIAVPTSIIALIVIFGTLIAAMVPIVLGGGCALIILATLYFLGHAFSLSIFTINIALLLGLCLSLDYSLFIIYRFRDELRNPHHTICTAIAGTIATAGRAVFFSGLAVFISLSALLFFPLNILFSIGIGGLAAVFVAVTVAITLLPAMLAILKHGINYLAILNAHERKIIKTWHIWRHIAVTVIKHRFLFFFSALVILLFLGYPFLNVRFGISDLHILPKHSESYQFLEAYQAKFNENELTPILLVVKAKNGNILSQQNINRLYSFTQKLKRNPSISQVNSIVTTEPRLSKTEYYMLYKTAKNKLDPGVKQLLKTTTGRNFTVLSVVSKYNSNAAKTMDLVKQLRKMNPGKGLTLDLTGIPVNNVDVLDSIARTFPYAVAWIMCLTYLILLVLLRSLFLPLKAILMNILSLCASYGVLVFVFQEGHLHQFLNFNPQGMLDISLLIIIFCALFGFSMDYEVFLLTRIREYYDETHDNDKSIVFGIEKSSKIITSAALIVIILCGSFMLADVLMVKEFGLGIAIAIFVDAFIIRVLLVPATMALVKQWNWYFPKWMARLLSTPNA